MNMTSDDAREYSESLGQIGEGWWRQIGWAFRQRIPETMGMSRRAWAEKYHGYGRLPIAERREAVTELTTQGMSTRQIADVLGVGQSTVVEDRQGDRSRSASAPAEILPDEEADRNRSEMEDALSCPPESEPFRTRLRRIRGFVLAEVRSAPEERDVVIRTLQRLIKQLERGK